MTTPGTAPVHRHDMDERLSIPVDGETALKGLLSVEPQPEADDD